MLIEIIFLLLQFVMPYQFLYYLQPIKEEEPQGKIVSNIKNYIMENNLLERSYLENTSFALFGKSAITSLLTINRFTGILKTKTRIDIDTLCETVKECCFNSKSQMIKVCSIEFLVKATYFKYIKFFKFIFLIEDINDNAPQFKEKLFIIEIRENQLPSKIALLPSAFDKDFGPNSKLEYRIEGNKLELRYFSIKNIFVVNEHKVELYSHISFDRETISEFVFELIAKDIDEKEAKLMIKIKILDENDSVPKFNINTNKVLKFQIYENCEIGSEIILFNVTDADEGINSEIVYTLNYENRKSLRILPFHINKKGLLFVSETVDREIREFYDLTVIASDSGIPAQMSSVKIHIEILDVNDNKPEFSLQTDHSLNHFSVEENSEIDTNIGTVEVIDRDKDLNSKISCSIEENSFSKYLKLERIDNYNIFKIQTKQIIDREVVSQLIMVLKCSDSGKDPLISSISITIDILDQNDNYPKVDTVGNSLNWDIMENNLKFTYINHIRATDLDIQENGRLHFFINESDSVALSQFSVDSETGIVKSKVVFDREIQDIYKITIFIRDNGKIPLSSSVIVTINILDENDNSPMFFTANPLYISITENTVPPYVVAHLNCKDRDLGNNAKFSLILQENTDYFTLNENGMISLKQSIDRELYSDFKLKIIAKDYGLRPLSSSINIIIEIKDINDNFPIFVFPDKNLQMNVSYDYTIGKKLITRIVATDSDSGQNGVVVFDHEEILLHSNKISEPIKETLKYFSINKNNGEITLINSLQPLFRRKYLIIVYAKDMGSPSLSSTVKIELSIVETRNSLYSNKASTNNDHDIFNISVIIIGCISVVIITVMIGAVMMLIFQKERNHRSDLDSCLMTSVSGKLTSALNDYELSSPSSINKNISTSSSNIHLIHEKNYLSNIRPVKFNILKHSNQSHISNYYEVIVPKDGLNNHNATKETNSNYQDMINNETQLINMLKLRNTPDSSEKLCFDKTSLV